MISLDQFQTSRDEVKRLRKERNCEIIRNQQLEVAMCDIADDCEEAGHPLLLEVARLLRSALEDN